MNVSRLLFILLILVVVCSFLAEGGKKNGKKKKRKKGGKKKGGNKNDFMAGCKFILFILYISERPHLSVVHHLSVITGLVVRHGDSSHEMMLSQ